MRHSFQQVLGDNLIKSIVTLTFLNFTPINPLFLLRSHIREDEKISDYNRRDYESKPVRKSKIHCEINQLVLLSPLQNFVLRSTIKRTKVN